MFTKLAMRVTKKSPLVALVKGGQHRIKKFPSLKKRGQGRFSARVIQ
jgi:hypothetical protein